MKKYEIIYFKVVFNFFLECNFCGPRTSNPTYSPLDGPASHYGPGDLNGRALLSTMPFGVTPILLQGIVLLTALYLLPWSHKEKWCDIAKN